MSDLLLALAVTPPAADTSVVGSVAMPGVIPDAPKGTFKALLAEADLRVGSVAKTPVQLRAENRIAASSGSASFSDIASDVKARLLKDAEDGNGFAGMGVPGLLPGAQSTTYMTLVAVVPVIAAASGAAPVDPSAPLTPFAPLDLTSPPGVAPADNSLPGATDVAGGRAFARYTSCAR